MVRWTSSRERLCLIDRALNMLCMGWPPNTRTFDYLLISLSHIR